MYVLCTSDTSSRRAYLVNDMYHTILRYDVRLNNLGSVDIVYAIADANDQAFALLCR